MELAMNAKVAGTVEAWELRELGAGKGHSHPKDDDNAPDNLRQHY